MTTSAETPKPIRRARRITPAQEDQIIELRIKGVSVRQTASIVGVSTSTVQRWEAEYLTSVEPEREKKREQFLQQAIERHELAAREAMYAWEHSRRFVDVLDALGEPTGDQERMSGDPRFLAEYRMAQAEITKLRGLSAAQRVEHSGEVITEIRWVEEVDGEAP